MKKPVKNPTPILVNGDQQALINKEAYEKVIISEARFRSYIELASQIAWVTNAAGEVVEDIPYFRKFTGLTYEQVKGNGWASALHPDDVANTIDVWNKSVKAKMPYETEYRVRRHDGIYRHLLAKGTPVLDDNGGIQEWVGVCIDITEHKLAEIMLRDEKERIRNILELVSDPIFVKDNNHRITYANKAFLDIFKMDKESVIGKTLVEAVPENERIHFLKVDREVLDTGITDIREEELTVDNFKHTIITKKSRFGDESGNRFLLGSIHDITDRKLAEDALLESREKYYYLYASSPVGMYHTKIDGTKVLEINESACNMMGYTRAELIGQPSSLRWVDPNRRSEIVKILNEHGVANNFDAEILKKDGTKISCLLSMKVFKDKDYIEGFIIDISDRKRAEEALMEVKENLEIKVKERTQELEKSKKLLEETGRLARVGGWEIDLVANSLHWSDITYNIHEVESDIVPDLAQAIDFYAPEAKPIISRCVEMAIAEGKPFDVELELITAKNNRLWVRAIGEAYTENGSVVRVGGVFQDINAQKLIQEELRKHREHLEEMVTERTKDLDKAITDLKRSNQELEQFAYVASHDLQEPLRMVSSYTQLLERRYKDKLDQDATDFINYAVDGATRMQRLINDLLEFSRVTTKGKILVKLDLSSVLGQAVANLHNKILETGSMIVNDDLPFAYGDEGQLVRVFQNLLDNAMKFKGKDSPRINVTSKILEDKVEISISDNGIGIDKIYSERVFTIFQRLHTKADYPGTGIGLAICKRTIERHGGTIWFESEPGKGTTFCFTLNIK
jgi:PAS domain S-box-containing protein